MRKQQVLIVPCGIEIILFDSARFPLFVLIVPCGIEIGAVQQLRKVQVPS